MADTLFKTGQLPVTPSAFPKWANDRGLVTDATRRMWENEWIIREKYLKYFSGSVFEEVVSSEDASIDASDPPLLYPVGVNLIKTICMAAADSVLGDWNERAFDWGPNKDDDLSEEIQNAASFANDIMDESDIDRLIWEVNLDREIYGAGVIKITSNSNRGVSPTGVSWSRVPLTSFFPVFDPDDTTKVITCYVVIPMTSDQAKAKYSIKNPSADVVLRVEKWTNSSYEVMVDGKKISAFSGANPFKVVPFVFIPRMITTHMWGDSLVEDLIRPQNELNARLADIGDAISYNAHPVRWVKNVENYTDGDFGLGPNELWNLGTRINPDAPDPEVGILEVEDPVSKGVMDYISFLYDWARSSSSAPPVVFGEDSGGAQRSGVTMEMRMAPLIRMVRRNRSYLKSGLSEALRISGLILEKKRYKEVPKSTVDVFLNGNISPQFASIMPRDKAAIVDEVQKGRSAKVISKETAVDKLGYGVNELDRIEQEQDEEIEDPKGLDGRVAAQDNTSKEPDDE